MRANVVAVAPQESLGKRAADSEKLRTYTRKKLAIAAQLRALLDLLQKRASEARFHRCEELMVKLAEDRFTLAVVGQFKRGKSSLMNAIIGRELLPTGVLPLTSAITILKFGPVERLVVRRANSVFPEIVSASALADYVTEKGNPGNRKKVKTATVEVPLPFLRRGLEFVDTPGVGSAIEANTATTYGFLPECDAVLFVTSVDAPFTETELNFLRTIREHVGKIFFILNKTDLLHDEAELPEILKFVESEIHAEMQATQARVFPLSAQRALTNVDFAGSGLKELQETLGQFLAAEKSAVFLAAIIERALRLIDEEAGDLELHRRAHELGPQVARERMEGVRAKWDELADVRKQLIAQFRNETLQNARDLAIPELDRLLQTENQELSRDLNRLLAAAGWSLGEEVAERWREFSSSHLQKVLAEWLQKISSPLETATEPNAATRQNFEKNLQQISMRATDAFDLKSRPMGELLPTFNERAVFDQRLKSVHAEHSLGWFSFLPAWLIRSFLKQTLQQQTDDFAQHCREQMLVMIDESVRRLTDQRAGKLNAVAATLESRLTAAITGERPAQSEWRQSSAPLREASWGDAKLHDIRDKLLALRDDSAHAETPSDQPELPVTQPNKRLARRETREVDLVGDLKTRGCAVCDHLIRIAFDFLAHWQYAISSEETAQEEFAREQGFCPLHMWQLHALCSTLGESIGLARLIEQTSQSLKEGARPGEGRDCRVCELVRQSELDYIKRFAAFVSDKSGRESYARSQGVCLRHLAAVLPQVSEDVSRFLLSETARHFDETAEEMQSYAIKRDAFRRTLGNCDEEDAHLRALIHFAGAKDISTAWPEDRDI